MSDDLNVPPGLNEAIGIAVTAHAGQTDKAGAPYILHPLRVMLRLETTDEMIVGVLHDVVEDSPEWSFERLREVGFSETVIAALDAVTKRDSETYDDFVARAAANPIGHRVKLADLQDNMDLSRIGEPSAKDIERLARYRRAYDFLTGK